MLKPTEISTAIGLRLPLPCRVASMEALSRLVACCYCCNSFVSTILQHIIAYYIILLQVFEHTKFYSMALPWDSSLL